MNERRVDQTRRGLIALLLAWPALLFARITGVLEGLGRRLPRLASKPLRKEDEPTLVRIERYSYTVSSPAKLGEPKAVAMQGAPDISIAADRIVANTPCPGFLILEELSIDGRDVLIGEATDAFVFSSLAMGGQMLLPPMGPKSRVVVRGHYTGFVPPGYVAGAAYLLCLTFMGRAAFLEVA